MKRILPCLLTAFMLAGCFNDGSETFSAIEYSRQGDNEMRHYRPIHRTHRDWSIAESAKTLTIKADQHIRLSVRTNPDRVIVRKGGVIIGYIDKTPDGAQFTPVQGDKPTSTLFCRTSHIINLTAGDRTLSWTFDDEGNASSKSLQLKTIGRHRFSVTENKPNSQDTCEGVEIESPFSAIGTLVFQEESTPEMAGYAWFLTKIDSDCLH